MIKCFYLFFFFHFESFSIFLIGWIEFLYLIVIFFENDFHFSLMIKVLINASNTIDNRKTNCSTKTESGRFLFLFFFFFDKKCSMSTCDRKFRFETKIKEKCKSDRCFTEKGKSLKSMTWVCDFKKFIENAISYIRIFLFCFIIIFLCHSLHSAIIFIFFYYRKSIP